MIGKELADEIGKRKGVKPSPGTIYPALKDLKRKKLIIAKKQGRETNYQISEKGKKGFKSAQEYFFRVFGEIILEKIEK